MSNFVPSPDVKPKYKSNRDSTSARLTDIAQLFLENHVNMNEKIKEDLDSWASLPLDPGNRNMTPKTNLPGLLYLFRSTPICVADSQFRERDRMILRFTWNGKTPRVRYKTLQLPKCNGPRITDII